MDKIVQLNKPKKRKSLKEFRFYDESIADEEWNLCCDEWEKYLKSEEYFRYIKSGDYDKDRNLIIKKI